MSAENLKGKIEIEFDESDIVSAAKNTTGAINSMGKAVEKDIDKIGKSATDTTSDLSDMGDKGKKSLKNLKDGSDNASKSLTKTGTSASKAATKIKETGTAGKKAGDDVASGAEKGARAMDKMSTSADGAENSMETLSTSMIGIAQTATGVSDAIFGLSASLVGLEKTQFGIKGMEIAIDRMERGLIVAYNEGILSTQELNDLTVDLGLAYFGLSLEEKQAAADSLALNGQMVTLAINTGAAVFQSVILIKTLTAMRGVKAAVTATTITESAATVTNTAVNTGNTGGIIAKTGATIASTVATVASAIATRAMTTAMLLSPLAPFAIAAIAAGAAFIALNDNIGGVRDSIEDLTNSEQGSIPTLGFSITGLGENIVDLNDEVVILNDSFENGQTNAANLADAIVIVGTTAEEATQNFSVFSSTLSAFESQIEGVGILALNQDMDTLISSIQSATENMDEFPERVNLAMAEIGPSITSVANQFDIAWGEGAFRKRLIEMRKFGDITREEFNQIGKVVDLTSKKIDELIKKNDNLKESQNELNASERSGGRETTNFLATAGDTPTRQSLVTQEFFNSLAFSPEAQRGVRSTLGPGAAPGTRERLARERSQRNSLAGVIAQALSGGGTLDRTQAGIQSRNSATINSIVIPIRQARSMGLSLPPLESETVGGYQKLAGAARLAIEKRNEEIFQERVGSFSILSRQLGVSETNLVTRNRAETVDIFSRLVDEETGQITEQQARNLLRFTGDIQTSINNRNGLAHRLAYLNRQQMIQNLP